MRRCTLHTWPRNQSEIDAGQDGRYYLQNAPEFLQPQSGTFFADGSHLHAPKGPMSYPRLLAAPSQSSWHGRASGRCCGQSHCYPHIGPEYTDEQIFYCGQNLSNSMRARDLLIEHTDTDELLCLSTAGQNPYVQEKNRCTGQAASHVTSAAVHFNFATDVQLDNLTAARWWVVWFGAGVRDSSLRHSTVVDTGAGGARPVRQGMERVCLPTLNSQNSPTTVREPHRAQRNDFRQCLPSWGADRPEATGLLMQVAHDSELSHNEIHAYYSGISVGWS